MYVCRVREAAASTRGFRAKIADLCLRCVLVGLCPGAGAYFLQYTKN